MQAPTESPTAVGDELLTDAKDVGKTAVNRLHSEIDTRKGDAANHAKSLSSAIDTASQGLDDDAPAWLKSALRQGAQQVQKFADSLETRDSRQLVDDVSQFARSSPGTFLAVCAATGFAAARMFKSGGSANSPSQLPAIGDEGSSQSTAGNSAPASRPAASFSGDRA